MSEEKEVNLTVSVDHNWNLKLNIYDLMQYLDEESMEKMAEIYAWTMPAWKAIVEQCKSPVASPNFDSNFFWLKRAFFLSSTTTDEDDEVKHWSWEQRRIVQAMQALMGELLEQNAKLLEENRRHDNGRIRVYNYIKDNFHDGSQLAWRVNSIYLDNRSETDEYPFKVAEKIVEQIDYKDYVKQWVETTQQIFIDSMKE